MILPERKTGEHSLLYEIFKRDPEFAVLFGARQLDGKPAVERINDELINNPFLEDIFIMGDSASGKSLFMRQLQKYLRVGPYRPIPELQFKELAYDPYSLKFTEGDEGPEEKVILRSMMNRDIVSDYITLQREARVNRAHGRRTIIVSEMPAKGRVNRGKDLGRHLADKRRKDPYQKNTLVIALESVSSIYDIGGQCRTIIENEPDGYVIEAALAERGVTIPNFRPADQEYLRRLKAKNHAMARQEQISSIRKESEEEAKRVLRTMSPQEMAELVDKMEVLKRLGETDQIILKQQLAYTHQLLHSQKLYALGYGLGFNEDATIIVVNDMVPQVVYDILGEAA